MIYKLNANSIRFLTAVFFVVVIRLKKVLKVKKKVHMESQGILNNQNNLEKVEKVEDILLSGCESSCKAIVI